MGNNSKHTVSISGCLSGIHDRFVDGLNCKDGAEGGIQMGQCGHDGRPNESAVIVMIGLRGCQYQIYKCLFQTLT